MTDEKKCPHCGSAAEMVHAHEPVSRFESVFGSYRDAYRVATGMAGMSDAITMVSVIVGIVTVLMFLAVASGDGLSAFVLGIIVGVVVGVMFWSYDPLSVLRERYSKSRSNVQCPVHLPKGR